MTKKELEICIAEYGKDIYSFCRQLTVSLQEADDLYQDTFLKALELIPKIDNNKNPKSYLLSIAVHIWKNKKRKFAWRKRIADINPLTLKTANVPLLYGKPVRSTNFRSVKHTSWNRKNQIIPSKKTIKKRIGGCFR